MRYLIIGLILALVLLAGCRSHAEISGTTKEDIIDRAEQKKQSLMMMLTGLDSVFKILLLVTVAGFLIWGLAKNTAGLVIAGSAIAGMALSVTFARYAEAIGLLVIVAAVGGIVVLILRYRKMLVETVVSINPFVTDKFKALADNIQSNGTKAEIKKIKRRKKKQINKIIKINKENSQ